MYPSPHRPKIIAHRGASGVHPENTLPAFQSAWECDADGIECDLRLTRDGATVAFHDPNLLRIFGDTRRLSQITLAELQSMDVGCWKTHYPSDIRVPTVDDIVLHAPRGKMVVFELKEGVALVKALAAVWPKITASGILPVLIAFDYETIRFARLAIPDARALWLFSDYHNHHPKELAPWIIRQVRSANLDGVDLRYVPNLIRKLTPCLLDANLQVFTYTINTPGAFTTCRSAGVHAITTDYPERFTHPPDGRNT